MCQPLSKVLMQLLQTQDVREVVDDGKTEDSQEVKSAEAAMMRKTPKHKFVARSKLGHDRRFMNS